MTNKHFLQGLISVLIFGAAVAQADELASWNFQAVVSGENNSWSDNAFTNAPSTGADVAQAVMSTATNSAASTGNNSLKITHIHETDLAAAIADQDYVELQLDAAPGMLLSITQVVFTLDNNTEAKAALLVDADQNGFDTGDDVTGELDLSLDGNSDEDAEWVFPLSTPAATPAVVRLYLYGTENQYKGQLFGEGWNNWDTDDDVVVYGTSESATGPADLSYVSPAPPPQIRPGEAQTLDVVIRNDGAPATNITVTLTAAHPDFTVNAPASINTAALDGGGGLVTNTFNVSASGDTLAQTFASAFNLNLSGYGNDGSLDTYSTAVAVGVTNTAFSSLSKTDFSSDTNGTDTATLSVSNTAAFALQFQLSASESWLLFPAGTQTLGSGSSTGITVTADASATAGRGQYTDTLSVAYLNNGSQPNPDNIAVTYDVGPKVSYVSNTVTVVSGGLLPSLPAGYDMEPGMKLEVEVFSINDGAIPVSNVVNSLSIDSPGFTITSLTPTVYPLLETGDKTSTVYQVEVDSSAEHGPVDFTVENYLP